MINSVRNTVLAVLNKNNYGYLSPQDFNLYCLQAQMDMFEDYFYQYNNWINRENNRTSGTGYADIVKGLEEVIDTFSVISPLLNQSTAQLNKSLYTLPTTTLNGSDYYLLNKILIYQTVRTSGTNTAVVGNNQLIDTNATFITNGVVAGDIVGYVVGGIPFNAVVEVVTSQTQLELEATNLTATGINYSIFNSLDIKEAEKVTHSKITLLDNSLLTKPTLTYPAYTQDALAAKMYPITIYEQGQVVSQYIRYPFTPNWTYLETSGNDPIFNASDPLYQSFELPLSDEPNLIMKILQYAGAEIREGDVVEYALGQPSDYVNWVRISQWKNGVLLPLTENIQTSFAAAYLQDNNSNLLFDQDGNVLSPQDSEVDLARITSGGRSIYLNSNSLFDGQEGYNVDGCWYFDYAVGARFGLNTETANVNPVFTIDKKGGVINFSSSGGVMSIVLEYVSDGMENGNDASVSLNKLFEDYIYAYIRFALLNGRLGVQEYVVTRARKDKSSLLRNAKLRLSNIHPGRLLMNMRGKDKWIK